MSTPPWEAPAWPRIDASKVPDLPPPRGMTPRGDTADLPPFPPIDMDAIPPDRLAEAGDTLRALARYAGTRMRAEGIRRRGGPPEKLARALSKLRAHLADLPEWARWRRG